MRGTIGEGIKEDSNSRETPLSRLQKDPAKRKKIRGGSGFRKKEEKQHIVGPLKTRNRDSAPSAGHAESRMPKGLPEGSSREKEPKKRREKTKQPGVLWRGRGFFFFHWGAIAELLGASRGRSNTLGKLRDTRVLARGKRENS